jgi:hypothetical protein
MPEKAAEKPDAVGNGGGVSVEEGREEKDSIPSIANVEAAPYVK